MKNFKTPCAFYGTKEELDALIEPLKGFSYGIKSLIYDEDDVLVTNYFGKNGQLAFMPKSSKLEYNRISAPASNIPLCLALAAMVEGDQPSNGEIYVMEKAGGWGYEYDNNGCLGIVTGVSEYMERTAIDGIVLNPKKDRLVEFCKIPLTNGSGVPIIRKATVPEIFAHNFLFLLFSFKGYSEMGRLRGIRHRMIFTPILKNGLYKKAT